ncbi:MAG: arginine--tRNA ligase [Bacteroidota bacterium]
MSKILQSIQAAASSSLKTLFDIEVAADTIVLQETKKEFEGDFTLVVFPLSRYRLGKPEEVGEKLGAHLVESMEELAGYNVIKGFLNLSLQPHWWVQFLAGLQAEDAYFQNDHGNGKTVVVEYCSPNTNKPLHLGHLRNIILGYSVTQLLQANGYEAIPTCLFNDRGTAICKSMYTWLQAGREDTPTSTGIKGDKLVGKYYVEFGKQLKAQVQELMDQGMDKKEAEKQAPINLANQELLLKWEAGDPETRQLWENMNGWVYEAFEHTFARLGVKFDQYYGRTPTG